MDESGTARIVVVYANDTAKSRASSVAAQLKAPLRHINETENDGAKGLPGQHSPENVFRLEIGDADSQLMWDTPQAGNFQISFTTGSNGYRRTRASPRSDTLARAIGLNRKMTRSEIADWSVLDATAGACTDTWAMAAYGCKVLAFERSGCLHVLQTDALHQATTLPETRECASRIMLIHADAGNWLQSLVSHGIRGHQASPDRQLTNTKESAINQSVAKPSYCLSAPDVIYIDPMYPHRKKSAAVKKGMQTLQRLLGPDLDSQQLLDAALLAAASFTIKRVVVKRPTGAELLNNSFSIEPAHNHESKNTRYDVYLPVQSLKF